MDVSIDLSVIVYKGSPVDATNYRHTAVFLEFADETNVVVDVTGASGFFQSDARPIHDPTASRDFVRKISVATIQGPSRATVESVIRLVPIDNQDLSWNCQHYVGDVLKQLSIRNIISNEAVSQGLDEMADVIVQAPDDA